MSGGSKNTTSVQKTEIPAELKPHLTSYLSSAANTFNNHSPSYYEGDAVANLNGMQLGAVNNRFGLANSFGGLNQAGDQLMQDTISGKYLDGSQNPHLSNIFENKLGGTLDNINAKYGMSGRTGSGFHADSLGQGAASVVDQVYGDNYRAERGNQMQAMQLDPMRRAMKYQDLDQAMGAGNVLQQQDQREIDAKMAAHDFNQNSPYQRLQNYGAAIHGANLGGTTSTTGPKQGGMSGSQMAGLGIMGASAMPAMFGAGGLGSAALGMMGFF